MKADKILFRCSALGHIMTEPQGKHPKDKYRELCGEIEKAEAEYSAIANKETKTAQKKSSSIDKKKLELKELEPLLDKVFLSESCKTHLVDVYVANKYNRHTEIKAKQLDKGNDVEEDSITVIARMVKTMFKKNEERISNEFISGTPDMFTGKEIRKAVSVRDAKSSWDIFSFNRAVAKELNPMNYWQGMGYIDLTGADVCYIDYCLNNTPYHLIVGELMRESYNHPKCSTPNWIELQIIANHTYDRKTFEEYMGYRGIALIDQNCKDVVESFVEVPLKERHHAFEIKRNQVNIDLIHQRVIDCRAWMNENLFKVNPEIMLASHDKEVNAIIIEPAKI